MPRNHRAADAAQPPNIELSHAHKLCHSTLYSREPKSVQAFDRMLCALAADGTITLKESHAATVFAMGQELIALRAVLEKAHNGLRWYRAEHPEDASPADDELDEEIAALATPPTQ